MLTQRTSPLCQCRNAVRSTIGTISYPASRRVSARKVVALCCALSGGRPPAPVTLGQVTILSLADARELARRALAIPRPAKDPQARRPRGVLGAAFGDWPGASWRRTGRSCSR